MIKADLFVDIDKMSQAAGCAGVLRAAPQNPTKAVPSLNEKQSSVNATDRWAGKRSSSENFHFDGTPLHYSRDVAT